MRIPIFRLESPCQTTDENIRLVEGSPDAQTIPNLGHKPLQPPTPSFNSGLILRLRSFAAELLDCQDFREEAFDDDETLRPCERRLEGILCIDAMIRTRVRPGNEYNARVLRFPHPWLCEPWRGIRLPYLHGWPTERVRAH